MIKSSLIAAMLALFIACTAQAQGNHPIKWACIGTSITSGAYPGKLATLLGPDYTVQNAGVTGTTVLKSGRISVPDTLGSRSYWTQKTLDSVFALKPSVIIIELGTNDSKALNWADSANFIRDYTALVDTLSLVSSRIWLCLPCPAWVTVREVTDINDTTIKNSIIPRIKQVAMTKGVGIVDFNTPLADLPWLFPDQKHPTDGAGADSLAAIVYRTCVPTVCLRGGSLVNAIACRIQADGPARLVRVFISSPQGHTATLTTLAGECIATQSGTGAIILQHRTLISGIYIVRVVDSQGAMVFRKTVALVRS